MLCHVNVAAKAASTVLSNNDWGECYFVILSYLCYRGALLGFHLNAFFDYSFFSQHEINLLAPELFFFKF